MINTPLEEGYFTIRDDGQPVLIGSYSPSSGNTYYPTRKLCPVTSEPVETIELPIEGELYSWTFVRMASIGSQEKKAGGGHGVGQVDLPCGTRIQTAIAGELGDWEIGMKMKLALLPVKQDGDKQLCSYQFEPIK